MVDDTHKKKYQQQQHHGKENEGKMKIPTQKWESHMWCDMIN